ncbi:sugar ABC transporter substrate-binding protein [Rhizobium laguerreae]|uniref:substrate-binding domain-containing protein n=1 Tax=Rhizobium laguerreae TaxID=1076926 RepID=UPI001C912A97|nr:substrate-binding domain-containing protein [Rhizobium laguerreae]MBY3181022.1 sugar ABC transporter substrate-binding protein [Rhizobium laguerreae]
MKIVQLLAMCLLTVGFVTPAATQDVLACLITSIDNDPFAIKVKEGATAKAKELGLGLRSYAGKIGGDSESQIAAIESCIADGAKGILLMPSNPSVIVSTMKKARDAGILVVALDDVLEPVDAADATIGIDAFKIGRSLGMWAKGAESNISSKNVIMFEDANDDFAYSAMYGFIEGSGIDQVPSVSCSCDCKKDECRKRCTPECKKTTSGLIIFGEFGQTIDIPQRLTPSPIWFATGPEAMRRAIDTRNGLGASGITISGYGGCPSVGEVRNGGLSATVLVFADQMAMDGIDAIATFAQTGETPAKYTSSDYILVTDRPQPGVESIDSKTAMSRC